VKSNGKVDALTRRLGDLPEGGDEYLKNMDQVVLKPQNLPEQLCLLVDHPPAKCHPSISNLMAKAYETDLLPGKTLEAIQTNGSLKEITIAKWKEQVRKIQYRGKCYIAENDRLRLRLIQEHHHTPLAGRLGRAKTFDLFDRQYYWNDMWHKWISMYGIALGAHGPGPQGMQRPESFSPCPYRNNHGKIYEWILW